MKNRTLVIISFIVSTSALIIAGAEYLHIADNIMGWLAKRFGKSGGYVPAQQDTANDGFNNPGNLKVGGDTFAGETTQPGKIFRSFIDTQHGYRAMLHQLATYSSRDGLKTFREMINRYSPASDGNNVEQYIANVVARSSISPDLPLFETYSDDVIKDVVAAMTRQEQESTYSINMEEIEEGFALA